MLTERRLSTWLFAAISLIAAAFIAASVYANWLSVAIEGGAHDLASNALPSLVHLTAAVDGLRDIEAATDDYADLGLEARPAARARIEVLWRRVDAELTTYLQLPAFPGERDLYRDVPPALRALDDSMQGLYARVDAEDREGARAAADRVVRVRANAAAALLRKLVSFNATTAEQRTAGIDATHHRVVRTSVLLNAVTLLLTGVVAVWLWRMLHRYSLLQREYAAVIEHRAEELEVFGKRVAHDLMSPLSSLSFCLTAFKPAAQSDPRLRDALTRANDCVKRGQRLVDDVFDFARSGGEPRPDARSQVAEVVSDVLDEARASVGADEVELELGALPDGAVRCSRGVLASILNNLVRNAIKYTEDSAVRRVTVRGAQGDGVVRLEVEDTGPGIPPGMEDAIFEPYVRVDGVTQTGLGLGLATVKRFCEAHGGSAGVRSTLGKGSIFLVTLPEAGPLAPGALPPVSARQLTGVRR